MIKRQLSNQSQTTVLNHGDLRLLCTTSEDEISVTKSDSTAVVRLRAVFIEKEEVSVLLSRSIGDYWHINLISTEHENVRFG